MTTAIRRSDSLVAPDLFQYHDHFTFLATIGETRSSQVFKVVHRQSGEVFAVKRSRKRFRSKLQRERCLREVQMVASLPEMENIVAQYRAWQEGGHFYIQMDYCDGGSLHQHLDRQEGGRLVHGSGDASALWRVARDVSAGLQFLHSNNVLHLDIKPENLYTKKHTSVWKIGDFGLAIGKETTDWEEGDGDYVAPELLRAASEQPRPAADIFSLGATLYQCATGKKLPRCDGSPDADISGLLDDSVGVTVDADVRRLLQSMTLPDPRMRPSASQVLAYAEAVLGADVARPSLEADPSEGDFETAPVDGRALAFGPSLFDQVDEVDDVGEVEGIDEVGEVEGIDEVVEVEGIDDVANVEDVNDVDTSRSSCRNDQCNDLPTSADRSSNPSNPSDFPPKLPLLNLRNKTNAANGGLSSASNSFRIMRRDTARDSDSEYGSNCDTERTMTTTTDMYDIQCHDDLNDMVSPRRDGGLFGPLSSRLLRGHGSLTFDMASPDVHISGTADRLTGLTGQTVCNGCSGCDACGRTTTAKQEATKPSQGQKSQSRTGYLQDKGISVENGEGNESSEHEKNMTRHHQSGAGAAAKTNRIGLNVWNEFEDGADGANVSKRYRSPFADRSEYPPGANDLAVGNDLAVDKENVAAITATGAEIAPAKLKTTTMTTKKPAKKKGPPVPLLPIQSNKLASKQTFGKKRQHSHRNSSRSARSSHRSGTNDVNLSARSLDVLMPPKKKAEYEHAGVSIESLHGELSARMKI